MTQDATVEFGAYSALRAALHAISFAWRIHVKICIEATHAGAVGCVNAGAAASTIQMLPM